MPAVGYICGASLAEVQRQWSACLDAGCDVILFDRTPVLAGLQPGQPAWRDPRRRPILDYMDNMSAGQEMTGTLASRYFQLEDLVPGDILVLTDITTLLIARPDAWAQIRSHLKDGGHLAVLSTGFHTNTSHGGFVVGMMDVLYEIGCARGREPGPAREG